jgi:ABC-type glycerol-3-phosphate transport system permease component
MRATPHTRDLEHKTRAAGWSVPRVHWPSAGTTVHYTLLCILLFLSFFLVLLMIDLSLRPSVLIYVDFWGLPWPPSFANYHTALFDLVPAMWRTLWVSAVSVGGVLFVSCLAAYAFARMSFPGQGMFFLIVLAVMMIPGVILLTPQYILANQLTLRGSLWGLVIFYIAGGLPFGIFLITTFFRSQPSEVFEAARIDGASEAQSLLRIAVPLAMPILVTVAIFNFIGIYGDFIWPTLMLSQDQQTLLMALAAYAPQLGQFASEPDIGAQTAGYAFATLPQLVIFAFGMKYFIQGVTSGAVKA